MLFFVITFKSAYVFITNCMYSCRHLRIVFMYIEFLHFLVCRVSTKLLKQSKVVLASNVIEYENK